MVNPRIIGLALVFFLFAGLVSSAGTISSVVVYGENKLPGFIKSNDILYAEGVFFIQGDPAISISQVKFGSANAKACTAAATGFKCYVDFPYDTYFPSRSTIQITLYNDQGGVEAAASQNIVIDGKGPVLDMLFDRQFIKGLGEVVVNYSVIDTAFSGDSVCSGIGGLMFYVSPSSEEQFPLNIVGCTAKGSVEITVGNDKEVEVCGAGYDKLNQTGAWDCVTVSVDSIAPLLVEGSLSFQIKGLPENSSFIGPGVGYVADVFVRVKDAAIIASGVTADFKNLNEAGDSRRLSANECYYADVDVYECVFRDVQIVLGAANNVPIEFSVSDIAGNSATGVLSYNFGLDSEGPEVAAIIVNGGQLDPQWVGKTIQSVSVEFLEEGSGMVAGKAFLDMSYFGSGDNISAEKCYKKTDGKWACLWRNLTLPGDAVDGIISVSGATTDAMGNLLKGSLTKAVIVDGMPAEILEFNITQPDAPYELPENIFLEGIPIVMRAKVGENREILSVRISPAWIKAREMGNLSNATMATISSQMKNPGDEDAELNALVTQNCVPLQNFIWECTYILDKPEPGVYDAGYMFEDGAKNAATQQAKFTVVDLRYSETAYWSISGIERMPSAIDRGTAPFLHHQVLYSISLGNEFSAPHSAPADVSEEVDDLEAQGADVAAPASSVTLLKVMMENCTGDLDYAYKLQLMDGSDIGNFPLAELILEQKEMPLRDLQYKCNLNLFSLVLSGNDMWVNENPEILPVVLDVPFYDTTIPSVILQEKIQKALDNPWQKITENPAFQYAELAVEIGDFVVKLDNVLLQLGIALNGIQVICPECAFLAPVSDGIMKIHEFNGNWMWLVTCNETVLENWFGKESPVTKVVQFVGDAPKNLGVFNWQSELMNKLGYSEQEIMDPRSSLVASISKQCIPGILQNLRQLSNINCGYAYCLQQASNQGMQPTYCDELKDYLTCVAVGEEVAYFAPITKVYDDTARTVNTILESPWHTVVSVIGGMCEFTDSGIINIGPIGSVCDIVLMTQGLEGVRSAISSIANWKAEITPNNYCAMMEE